MDNMKEYLFFKSIVSQGNYKCLKNNVIFFLQCFGLLGVNGAGKTTIFKMLTGDIGPTDGRLLMQDETGYGGWIYSPQ